MPSPSNSARLPQPLHIFRKDLLHLWPETLVVLLLFVAFAWAAPSGWSTSIYAGVALLLAGFLKYFLMPISWLVVISRLIHDESLVGDRQFWTSRPYHWANLLAAKLLYLLAFLYLPFLLMQVYLLKHAGLYPTTVIPALLHNLLLLTIIIVIPLTAIAAVTGTFARMLLASIAAVIYLLVLSLGTLYFLIRRMPPPSLDNLLIVLLILLPAGVLVYQYATRKTHISRILLIGTPLLIVLLLLITPATALIRHAYQPASASDPRLSTVPSQLLPQTTPPGRLRILQGNVQIGLPVATAGIDEQSDFAVRGAALTLDAPGVHWSSPYLTEFATEINAGRPGVLIPVSLPLSVFDQVRSTPVDLHLSLAADHLKLDTPTTWHATLLPFAVPGHGICAFSSDNPDDPPVCRYPFATPQPNFVSARLPARSCAEPENARIPQQMNLTAGAATLDFDPVITATLSFASPRERTPQAHPVCPGTPLEFVQATTQGKTRLEIDLKQMKLDPLAERYPEGPSAAGMTQVPSTP